MPMLRTLQDKVDPRHTAVVVVDVQNDFFADGGTFDRIGRDVGVVRAMIPPLERLLESARRVGTRVVFLRYEQNVSTESEVHLEQRSRGRADQAICSTGTWGADFYVVEPQAGEPVVIKNRYSGFISTNLDLVLKTLGVRTLVMTGIASNGCVEATARDGFMYDYYIVFAEDCTASYSPDLHRAACTNITDAYGIVTSSGELVGLWDKEAAAALAVADRQEREDA